MAAAMGLIRMPPSVPMPSNIRKLPACYGLFSVSRSPSSLTVPKCSISRQNNADMFAPSPGKEVDRPHLDIDEEIPNGEASTVEITRVKVAGAYSKKREKKYLNLTVMEKKELVSHALGLGKKLKFQLVGKFGVTDNVVASFMEIFEASELLKVKVLKTCPDELDDVAKQLEEATDSVVVEQIGRTMIVYRPSSMKQKAGVKKQDMRVFTTRERKPRPVSLRFSGNGRGGASRG